MIKSSLNRKCLRILMTIFLILVVTSGYAFGKKNNQKFINVNLNEDLRWVVDYLGSDYDPDADQTTFTYEVTVFDDPALSHFTAGLPDCEGIFVVNYSPKKGVEIGKDPKTRVYGIKWDVGLEPGMKRTYSYTLAGRIGGYGTVPMAVKAGLFIAGGEMFGPSCEEAPPPDTFGISGRVFWDTNGNGTDDTEPSVFEDRLSPGVPGEKDPEEPVLAIVVELYSNGILIATTTTDTSGVYYFDSLTEGEYTVVVPLSTYPDNITLNGLYTPTTATQQDITLSGANSDGIDFGFYLIPHSGGD